MHLAHGHFFLSLSKYCNYITAGHFRWNVEHSALNVCIYRLQLCLFFFSFLRWIQIIISTMAPTPQQTQDLNSPQGIHFILTGPP